MSNYSRFYRAIGSVPVLIFSMFIGIAHATDAIVYKNPNCGCCEDYADYLRDNGFSVTVEPTHELAAMSLEQGISAEYQGCHLVMMGGYVVSGHVPMTAIEKMLSERPDIKGITLPGMPMGSPGMGGKKAGIWEIFAISDAEPTVFATE